MKEAKENANILQNEMTKRIQGLECEFKNDIKILKKNQLEIKMQLNRPM